MKRLKEIFFSLLTLTLLMPVLGQAGQITEDKFNAAESFINIEQGSTPSAPAAGSRKLYFKTDNKLYIQDESGTETVVQEELPIADTTAIVKGSSDATKLFRVEIDGITTGTTRVLTMPDLDLDLGTINTKLGTIETSADVTDATNVDAAGAVMESDYDANTVLAADTDNTPAALTIAEQTLIGRITGGNITGLTESQVKTLLSIDNVNNLKFNLNASAGPTVDDDTTQGYSVGSMWVDVSNDATYICQDASTAAAVWTDVTSGAAGGDPDQNTFTNFATDTGTTPVPDTTTDTLTYIGGDGIRTDGDSTGDSITISACDDDGDTCFKNETSSDDDVARVFTAGTERAFFDSNGLSLASGESVNEFSADEDLSGDSDDAVPTEQAVKAYVDNRHHHGNFLINGGFTISQRGTSFDSTTDPANSDFNNTLDRWAIITDGNDSFDISQESVVVPSLGFNSIKLDSETANRQGGIIQAIPAEQSATLTGGVVSLSFDARTTSSGISNIQAAVLCWTGTADTITDPVSAWGATPTWVASATSENTPSNLTLTDSFQRFSVENISVDTASCNNVIVAIWIADTTITVGDLLYISNVKLNIGNSATPYFPEQRGAELHNAKYFYERQDFTSVSDQIVIMAGASATNRCEGVFNISPKRSVPTWHDSGSENFKCASFTSPSGSGLAGNLTFGFSGVSSAILSFSLTTAPLTLGEIVYIQRDGTDTAWISAESEIQGN